jgi:hypothetical protein
MDNRQLYESILKGFIPQPKNIISSLAYNEPITETAKIGNTVISAITAGGNSIVKIAIGSNIIYDSIAISTSFNYFYQTIDLLYVESIANDIYGLHYDLIGASTPEPDVYTQSLVYDKIDKTYSWF